MINDGKVLGYDEGIKMGSTYGDVLSTILGHLYGIILAIDVIICLGSLDVSFEGFNDVKIEGLSIED